jgi:hypothetical protein
LGRRKNPKKTKIKNNWIRNISKIDIINMKSQKRISKGSQGKGIKDKILWIFQYFMAFFGSSNILKHPITFTFSNKV